MVLDPFLLGLQPDVMVSTLADIPLEDLFERKIQGLLLDLDRTLAPWATATIPDSSFAFVEKARRTHFKLCIVSNSLLRKTHVQKVAQTLKLPYVASAFKPRRMGLRKALQKLQLSAPQAAMIGDQVLTDIWAGKRMGMMTVLVDPLGEKEFLLTRLLSRNLEEWIKRFWKQEMMKREALRSGNEGTGKTLE